MVWYCSSLVEHGGMGALPRRWGAACGDAAVGERTPVDIQPLDGAVMRNGTLWRNAYPWRRVPHRGDATGTRRAIRRGAGRPTVCNREGAGGGQQGWQPKAQ